MKTHELERLLSKDFPQLSREEKIKLLRFYLEKISGDVAREDVEIQGFYIVVEIMKDGTPFRASIAHGTLDIDAILEEVTQ